MGGSWSISNSSSAHVGFWGNQTSNVNFCEEDYIVTHYIAEFFNTLTSLSFSKRATACIFGLHLIYLRVVGYGIHGIRRYKRQNDSIFDAVNLPYWGLIGVGIFSSLYHTTLKYHTQMADEMSMHLAIGCALIQVFTFQQPPWIQKRNAAIIVVGLTSFVIYHCVTDEFVLHVTLFIILCVTVTTKTRMIIRERIKDKTHKAKMSALATFGSCTALFAYFLWNIDVHFCPTLTHWKQQLGMPLAILLELHGYWHILTAIASYAFMAMIEFLTSPEVSESHGLDFAWPAKAVFEDIVPKKNVEESKATANGTVPSHGPANSAAK